MQIGENGFENLLQSIMSSNNLGNNYVRAKHIHEIYCAQINDGCRGFVSHLIQNAYVKMNPDWKSPHPECQYAQDLSKNVM